MLFNSFVFVGFFLPVYAGYLLLRRNLPLQNAFLLLASLVFYGYWDWRFLILLAATIFADFFAGILIGNNENPRTRKTLVILAVTANLVILGFFKYFNFFAQSAAAVLEAAGFRADAPTLQIILPLGISFYVFQSMSYTIDVYRRQGRPCTNIIDYALYVTFFPQLVAGPIQRHDFIDQIASPRRIKRSEISPALFLLLLGYFKKIVVADNVGVIADRVFENYAAYGGLDIILGVMAFTLQIYCDFSGYSDIARGLAKLMGFELMVNFNLPYFAVSPRDFWSRWHISLSTWLRDYLYIPLGGNRGGESKTRRNLILTMLLGGLWHGAAWNFVLWGLFHGSLLAVHRSLAGRFSGLPGKRLLGWAATFGAVVFGWVIFRSNSWAQFVHLVSRVSLAPSPESPGTLSRLVFFAAPLLVLELWQHWKEDHMALPNTAAWVRVPAYGLMLAWIALFAARNPMQFIYFQF